MNRTTECEGTIEIKCEIVDLDEFVTSEQFVQVKVELEETEELTSSELNCENVLNEEISPNTSEKNAEKTIIKEEISIPDEFVTISQDKDLVIDKVNFEEIVENETLNNCENEQIIRKNVHGEIGICNENAKEFIIKCKICSKTFITLSDLNSHECCNSNNKTLTSRKSLLKIHQHSAQNEDEEVQAEIYQCDKYKETFETKDPFLKHLNIHIDGEKHNVCQTCGKKCRSASDLKEHIHSHTGERPHKCQICQKRFMRKSHLVSHTKIHREIKQCKCNKCENEFRTSWELKQHKRTKHSGERQFECQICHKRFTSNGHLTQHKRIHSGEKPFKCNECEKSFSQSHHLTQHIRIHNGERPFSCTLCDKSFRRNSNLLVHMRIHSGSNPHECKECGKKFIQSNDLKMHIRIHSGFKPFECQLCPKLFTRRGGLKKHVKFHEKNSTK